MVRLLLRLRTLASIASLPHAEVDVLTRRARPIAIYAWNRRSTSRWRARAMRRGMIILRRRTWWSLLRWSGQKTTVTLVPLWEVHVLAQRTSPIAILTSSWGARRSRGGTAIMRILIWLGCLAAVASIPHAKVNVLARRASPIAINSRHRRPTLSTLSATWCRRLARWIVILRR